MIPVFITTVAQRAEFLPMLIERAGGESCAFPVFDPEMKGVWFNTRRALERGIAYCTEHGMTHFVTLQDDVWPVDEFQRHVTNAAAAISDRVFSLFGPFQLRGRAAVHLAQEHAERVGAHWSMHDFTPAQGFVWPAIFAFAYLSWVDSLPNLFDLSHPMWGNKPNEYRYTDQDDHILNYYLTAVLGRKPLATAPSLIEHLGNQSTLRSQFTGEYLDNRVRAQVYRSVLVRDAWNTIYAKSTDMDCHEYKAGIT